MVALTGAKVIALAVVVAPEDKQLETAGNPSSNNDLASINARRRTFSFNIITLTERPCAQATRQKRHITLWQQACAPDVYCAIPFFDVRSVHVIIHVEPFLPLPIELKSVTFRP